MLDLAKILVWLGGPLFVAALIAHLVRLPQFTRRIALVVYAGVLTAVGLFPWSEAMRLGIDLSGGTILVYQVEQPLPEGFSNDKMVSALNRRINPAGVMDVTIRGVGEDRVEIIIPRASQDEVQRCKRILTSVGSLEFRILANSRDHAGLIARADSTFPRPIATEGTTLARWIPVAEQFSAEMTEHGGAAIRTNEQGQKYVLVVNDLFDVTGEYLRRAESTIDEMGRPAVGFHFNSAGGTRFAGLTAANLPSDDGFERRLAILLNGEVYSAPGLRDQIHDNGIITGDFSQQEVEDLVSVLNAGSLPGVLVKTPASELSVGPTLGRDTVQSGIQAMLLATIVVLVFMAAYYRLAGMVANVAVVLNVLIVLGVMAWVNATWTLPGLAGLALTVGMAVDANVLIYERLREEQQRGRSLRLAIEYAFHRALRPILDSNITTLLAAAVLYAIGSEQVKGFAVTLIIGLLANLFTAVFVCRLIFDVLEKNRWITRVKMAEVFRRPNFDFVGKRRIAAAGSILLILAGLTGLSLRGADLMDIDFTGGTLAAVRFQESTDSSTVRSLAQKALPDATVEELQLRDEPAGHRFLIRTTLQDPELVKAKISDGFGEQLARVHMTQGPISEIPMPAEPQKDTSAEAKQPAASRASVASRSFAGGQRVELRFDNAVALAAVGSLLEESFSRQGIVDAPQRYSLIGENPAGGDAAGYTSVRLETDVDRASLEKALPRVADRLAEQSMFERLDNFGGQVAREMQSAAFAAVVISMFVIVGYLWIRFQNVRYGLGAVVALVHDVLIVLGLVAISRWLSGNVVGDALMLETFKINLPMVAAFLTLVGYSVNDTIVVFDRIRESKGKGQPITWELINDSINQTLSRTVLTGLTTWVVALILYLLGGPAIHGFAFCLVAGVIVGTYSSIYIASPVLMWFGGSAGDPRLGGTAPASSQKAGKPADRSEMAAAGGSRKNRKVA